MDTILYSYINCPHSLKAAFFLSEKGIPFQRVEVNLGEREQKTPVYQAINPAGTVPAYEDAQGILGDSLDIMRHADLQGSGPHLFPDEPDALAEVLAWIKRADVDFWDVSHHLYWQLIEAPETGTDWQEVARLKAKGYGLLNELEARLSQHAFVCGDFSAADIALLPWVYGFQRFDLPEAGQHPHVARWRDSLAARETFQQNYKQAGMPLQHFLAQHNNPS